MAKGNVIKYVACILLGVAITSLVMHYDSVRREGNTSVLPSHTSPPNTLSSETSVSVAPKSNPAEPDLIFRNVYVADINGNRVEAPVVSKSNQQATVKNVIDVTPLVKQMTPKWEAGVGVDVDNHLKVSPCVSLQRNYKQDKAVEMVITIDKSNGKIEKGMLLYKWMF